MSAASGKPLGDVILDADSFKKSLSYPVIDTNIAGVYQHAVPAEGFDPRTASAAALVKNGFLIRRPGPSDPPALQNAWKQAFSREWLAKDQITVKSTPQPGKTHNLRNPPRKQTDRSFVNAAWAGGVIDTGKWTGLIGYWEVPTVSKPSEAQGTEEGGWDSSSWIGIDGFGLSGVTSNDVLQAGIQQEVSASGVATYVPWYEWFVPRPVSPHGPVDQFGYPVSWVGPGGQYQYIFQTNIDLEVSPGQQIYCSVQYAGGKSGSITFANNTTGQSFSITLAPPPGATFAGNTLEWIMEAPGGGEPDFSLPKFTDVNFTRAIGCGAEDAVANPATGDVVNVETSSGKQITAVTLGNETVTISFTG